MDVLNQSGWLSLLGWFALLFGISALIRKVTKDFDNDVTPELRIHLAKKIQTQTAENATWMLAFNSLFTKVFGSNHLSWLCIRRSLFLTVLTFSFLYLATGHFFQFSDHQIQLLYDSKFIFWSVHILFLIAIAITFNGILDYLSLWQTRLVIRSNLPVSLKIAVDLLFTTLIVILIFAICLGLVVYYGFSVSTKVEDQDASAFIMLSSLTYSLQFMDFPPKYGTLAFVFFATSFSTSIWLILHIFSGHLLRWLPKVGSALNVVEAPIRATGVVAIGLVWIIGTILAATHLTYVIFTSS